MLKRSNGFRQLFGIPEEPGFNGAWVKLTHRSHKYKAQTAGHEQASHELIFDICLMVMTRTHEDARCGYLGTLRACRDILGSPLLHNGGRLDLCRSSRAYSGLSNSSSSWQIRYTSEQFCCWCCSLDGKRVPTRKLVN